MRTIPILSSTGVLLRASEVFAPVFVVICAFLMTQSKQEKRIEQVTKRAIRDLYERMEALLELVPEGTNLDEESEASQAVGDVIALEEEWFLNPMVRERCSLLDFRYKEEDQG